MQFVPAPGHLGTQPSYGNGLAPPQPPRPGPRGGVVPLRAGDLRDGSTRAAAILSYNHSSAYVALVDAYEAGYRTGVFDVPTPSSP